MGKLAKKPDSEVSYSVIAPLWTHCSEWYFLKKFNSELKSGILLPIWQNIYQSFKATGKVHRRQKKAEEDRVHAFYMQ